MALKIGKGIILMSLLYIKYDIILYKFFWVIDRLR